MSQLESVQLEQQFNFQQLHAYDDEVSLQRQEETRCPQCGALMARSIGYRGQYKEMPFLKCTNFPQCRAVLCISEQETSR